MNKQLKDLEVRRISRKTLRFIFLEIKKLFSNEDQIRLCIESGLNKELIQLLHNEGYDEDELLYTLFLYHSKKQENFSDFINTEQLYRTIVEFVDPELNHLGFQSSERLMEKLNSVLKYDGLHIQMNKTIYKGKEEWIPEMDEMEEHGLPYVKALKNELIDLEFRDTKDNSNMSGLLSSRKGLGKLEFYPDTGLVVYRTSEWNFKQQGKGFALLDLLSVNKNTPYSLKDIIAKCNFKIAIESHKFKTEKDLRDTISLIKRRLKVNNREYFPIFRRKSYWIWEEK